MALTVTEREHWKERVAKQIDKAIVAVYCEKEPGLLQRVENEAKRQAAAQLGLEEVLAQREQLASDAERLERQQTACRRLVAAVTGRFGRGATARRGPTRQAGA